MLPDAGASVESASTTTAAAFLDLDKTIISQSGTLAFAPSFYRYGLSSRTGAMRGACAQLAFRLGGAGQRRMDRVRAQLSELCGTGQLSRSGDIVSRHLAEIIGPYVYAEARDLIAAHAAAGRDVTIVSTSGQEMVRRKRRLGLNLPQAAGMKRSRSIEITN